MMGHPAWCAGEPLCTVHLGGRGASHRSEVVTYAAPAVTVSLTLFQAAPGWPTEPHITIVVSDDLKGTNKAGCTMSIADAWRLADALTATLEQVR